MNVPKLRELKKRIEEAASWHDVENAKTRTLAFLRSEADKQEAADFADIKPPIAANDAERVKLWKSRLASYVDGLLDAWDR